MLDPKPFRSSHLKRNRKKEGADLGLDRHSSRPYWGLFRRVFQFVRDAGCPSGVTSDGAFESLLEIISLIGTLLPLAQAHWRNCQRSYLQRKRSPHR